MHINWIRTRLFFFPVTYSPGGVAYERDIKIPDWVLDYWHPIEKAAFPKYFALREQRKKEFIKFWERNYANKKWVNYLLTFVFILTIASLEKRYIGGLAI